MHNNAMAVRAFNVPSAAAAATTRLKPMLQPDGTMLIEVTPEATAPLSTKNVQTKGSVLKRTPTPLSKVQVHAPATSRGPKPWQNIPLAPDPVFEEFKSGCGLKSSKSVRTYILNLKTARQIYGMKQKINTVQHMIAHVDAFMAQTAAATKAYHLSLWTHCACLGALLAVTRHVVSCKSKARPEVKANLEKLVQEHKKIHLLASQGALQNKAANPRQQLGWVPYLDLLKIKNGLPKGSRIRMLFSCYLLIPPARCDWAQVKI